MPPKAKAKAKPKVVTAKATASNKTKVIVNVNAPARRTRRKAPQDIAPPPRALNTRAAPLGTNSPYMIFPTGLEGLRAEVTNLRGDIQRATQFNSSTVPQLTNQLRSSMQISADKSTGTTPEFQAPPPEVSAVQKEVASYERVPRPSLARPTIPTTKPPSMKPAIPSTPFLQRSRQRPTVANNIFREPPPRIFSPANLPSGSVSLLGKRGDEASSSSAAKRQKGTKLVETPVAVVPPERYNVVSMAEGMRQQRDGRSMETLEKIRASKRRIVASVSKVPTVIRQANQSTAMTLFGESVPELNNYML